MSSKLFHKQVIFSKLVAKLIQKAESLGYGVTLGEAWRPPEMAEIYAQQGKGIKGSLHMSRLAIDLNLFIDTTFLTKTEDYTELGRWWEAQSTDEYQCCWGGRFNDGNHFSISHGGKK